MDAARTEAGPQHRRAREESDKTQGDLVFWKQKPKMLLRLKLIGKRKKKMWVGLWLS